MLFSTGRVGRQLLSSASSSAIPAPSLDLDFTTGVLDGRITLTRTSNATYFDVAGILQTAGFNVARFDYHPITHAPQGFLVEEARTNVLLNSSAINSWPTKTDTTVTDNSTASPDGTTNASLCTEGVAGTAVVGSNTASVTANSPLVFSLFLKRGNTDIIHIVGMDTSTINGVQAWANLATGAISSASAMGTATIAVSSLVALGNGWYRAILSCTMPAGSSTALINTSSAVSVGSSTRVNNATYYMWGAQIETGSFVTTYIPTAAVSATRLADVANMPVAAWYTQTQGSWAAEYILNGVRLASFPRIVQLDDGTNSNSNILLFSASSGRSYSTGNVASVTSWALGPSSSIVLGAAFKMGASWITGAQLFNLNGIQPSSAAFVPVPSGLTTLRFAADPGASITESIYLRRVRYWQQVLNADQLSSVTR